MPGPLISIYRPDVFERLKGGEEGEGAPITGDVFFGTCIATQYDLIARDFGCRLKLSAFRVEDARRLWIHDIGRVEMEPSVSASLDTGMSDDTDGVPNHFKQVGFLVYWLRRRCVVESVERAASGYASQAKTPQDRFILNANEISAFLFGFRICQFFELAPSPNIQEDVARIRRINLEAHFIHDAATLLRHKNLSPHALYLIYRALFYRLDWSQYEEQP